MVRNFSLIKSGFFLCTLLLFFVLGCGQSSSHLTSSSVVRPVEIQSVDTESTQTQSLPFPFRFSRQQATRGFLSHSQELESQNHLRKNLVVRLSACLQSDLAISDSTLRDIVFEISGDAFQIQKKLDPEGCLAWEDRLEFEYYDAEKWFNKEYLIKSSNDSSAHQKLTFYLNPWQTGNAFSWDIKDGEPPSSTGDLATPTFVIQDVVYLFHGQNYAIDQSMNLVFKKIYQLRFQPLVRRYDFSTDFASYQPVQDGVYRLRLMVLGTASGVFSPANHELSSMEEFVSQYRYLSGAETQIQVQNGVAITQVELPFSFQDIPWLAGRTQLLLELSPLEEHSGPRPTIVVIPFNAVSERGASGALVVNGTMAEMNEKVISLLSPGKFSVATLLDFGKNGKTQQDLSLDSVLGIRPLSPEAQARIGLTRKELELLVKKNKITDLAYVRALGKLCAMTAETQSKVRLAACHADPVHFFTVTPAKRVKRIQSAPVLNQSRVSLLSFNATLSLDHAKTQAEANGKSQAHTVNKGINSKVGLSLWVFSAGAEVGASQTTDWFQSNQVSYSQSQTRTSTVSQGKMLMVEELEFDFEADSVDCVYVSPAQSVKQVWAEQICSNEGQGAQKLRESWYYIYQALLNSGSPMRDPLSLALSPWIKLIRGHHEYDRFKALIENHRTYLTLKPSSISSSGAAQTVEGLAEKFTHTHPILSDGAIPGMLLSSQ